MILSFEGNAPTLAPSVFVAPDAAVIGRVSVGDSSSVWFGTVIRGDVHWITIGKRVNVQDRSVIHVTTDLHPTIIEDDVSVGHSVTLHGCTLKRGCLIGIGAVVLDQAIIGEGAFVGAGALVTPGTVIPPGVLALGSPARPKRDLTQGERDLLVLTTERYVDLGARYLRTLPSR